MSGFFVCKYSEYIHIKDRKYMILWFIDKNSTESAIQWKFCLNPENIRKIRIEQASIYIIWTNIPLKAQDSGNFVYGKPGDVPEERRETVQA